MERKNKLSEESKRQVWCIQLQDLCKHCIQHVTTVFANFTERLGLQSCVLVWKLYIHSFFPLRLQLASKKQKKKHNFLPFFLECFDRMGRRSQLFIALHYRLGQGTCWENVLRLKWGSCYACFHAYKVPAAAGVVSCNAISGDTTTREVAQFLSHYIQWCVTPCVTSCSEKLQPAKCTGNKRHCSRVIVTKSTLVMTSRMLVKISRIIIILLNFDLAFFVFLK